MCLSLYEFALDASRSRECGRLDGTPANMSHIN